MPHERVDLFLIHLIADRRLEVRGDIGSARLHLAPDAEQDLLGRVSEIGTETEFRLHPSQDGVFPGTTSSGAST